jgi:hypothetical protein
MPRIPSRWIEGVGIQILFGQERLDNKDWAVYCHGFDDKVLVLFEELGQGLNKSPRHHTNMVQKEREVGVVKKEAKQLGENDIFYQKY